MSSHIQILAPISRILLANIFLIDGVIKLFSYEAVAEWMFINGVPEASLPFVIIFEILGSFFIIFGWQTKLFSLLFFVFCILTAVIFHSDFSNRMEQIAFMKNVSMAGGFLLLFLHGSGKYSLESILNRKSGSH